VYVVSFRRSLLVAALVLAIPTFLHQVLNVGAHLSWFSILNIVVSFAANAELLSTVNFGSLRR